MTNEFKKLSGKTETRYVLEDGATVTTGAIATVEKPLGELQRRAEPPKPRNFVAKNAKMGGAGVHKDKKKAAKQGDVKHKNKDVAEAANAAQQAAIAIAKKKKKGLSEGSVKDLMYDLKSMSDEEFLAHYKMSKADARRHASSMSENGHPDEKEDKALIRQMVKRDALKKEGYGMNSYATAMGSHIQPGNGPDVSEDEDDVGQELGMAGSELYGIAKHAKELLALIHQQGQDQGLEAWQQSKITKAADYLTAVLQSMDYDANGDQGVEETDSYMESLAQKLAEKIPKGASVDYYIKDFAKSTAPQFKNKNPAKRKQMAVAAWNDSKRKK